MSDRVMLMYPRTPAMLYQYFLYLDLNQRGLVELMGERFFTTREELPESVEDIAYLFDLSVDEVQAAWDRRTQAAYAGFRDYLIRQIEDREGYVAEQSAAGLASAEARKSGVSEDEAKEVLGENFKVFEAFATHWHHKKVSEADCKKINSLIAGGKITADKLTDQIKAVAEATPPDKFQYMKSVGTWLDGGNYNASVKGANAQRPHLGRVDAEAKEGIAAAFGSRRFR